MKESAEISAFPSTTANGINRGMQLRDVFAAAALTGIITADPGLFLKQADADAAKWAYALADEMMEARKQ